MITQPPAVGHVKENRGDRFWAQLFGTEGAGDHDGHVFLSAREPGGFAPSA